MLITFLSSYLPIDIGESYRVSVLDRANQPVSTKLFDKEGRYVQLGEIPYYAQKAFIAIEDKDFYSHNGYNISRIAQAAVINTKEQSIKQGGSTITQQLARTLYFDNEKSYFRKGKEVFYAMAIENRYSKDQILEKYLNAVFLGHGLYGLDQASKYYFNIEPHQLTLAQSALLAGLCSSPNNYSPDVNYDKSKEMQGRVLFLMFEQGYITAEEYYQALEEPLKFHFRLDSIENDEKGYYLDAVNSELLEMNILTRKNLIKGIKIETNIDINITGKIQKIIERETLPANGEIGVVLMNSYSGKVISLIGGSDYNKTQFNRAMNARRQIGSTIKPVIYYLGLEKGMTPASEFYSEPSSYLIKNYGQFDIENAGDHYANRPINMIEALGTSDNVYAAKTMLLVGSDNIASFLNRFSEKEIVAEPTLAFGTAELTPLELASVYNTLASEGQYFKPQLIRKVTDYKGRVLYKSQDKGKDILNPNTTTMLSQLLRAPLDKVLNEYSYTKPTLVDYDPGSLWGAKTGTTESNNWVVGYNPHYTLAIYVGTDDNTELEATGLARRLFCEIAKEVSKNQNNAWYAPTSHLVSRKVNPVTLANSNEGSIYYFPRY